MNFCACARARNGLAAAAVCDEIMLAPDVVREPRGLAALVELDADHPGFHDPHYRRRRNEIARAALEYRDGDPVPLIDYTSEEQAVWREIWRHLEPLHARYACREYLEVAKRLALSREKIPQLAEVN